tara:strand:+ start:80 stop:1036 length:957 start_codon:yes stop_codon:yes gene_type:complete
MATIIANTFTQQATAAITHEIAKPVSKKEDTRRNLVAQLADYNVTVGNPMTAKIGDLRGLLKDAKAKAKATFVQKPEEKQEKKHDAATDDDDLDEDVAGLLSELEVTAKELAAESKESKTEKVKLSKDEKRALLLQEAESLQMATEPLEDEGLGVIRKAITARKKELKQEKKMKAADAKEEKKRKKDMKKVLREVIKVAKKKTKTMKKNKLGKRQQIKNELVESIMGFVNPDVAELNFEPAVLQDMSTKDLRKKLKELVKASAPSKEDKAFQRKVANFINKEKERRAVFGEKMVAKFGVVQTKERMDFIIKALAELNN